MLARSEPLPPTLFLWRLSRELSGFFVGGVEFDVLALIRTADQSSRSPTLLLLAAVAKSQLGLDGSSSRQQCWTGTTSRSTPSVTRLETWHTNLEYSTESQILNLKKEDKKNLGQCSCSAKWKLDWCSIHLCFLDVVPYKERGNRQVATKLTANLTFECTLKVP